VDLASRFTQGKVDHVTVKLDQQIEQTLFGVKQMTEQTIIIGYTFTVDEIDAQGTAKLSVRYVLASFHAHTPDGLIEYDSLHPPGLVPPMASGLAALVGQGYTIHIDSHGTIKQIDGLPALLENVLTHSSIPQGIARTASEKILRQQLDEQNVRQTLGYMFAPLPDHPVAIGESWSRTAQSKAGLPLTVQSTYTLQSVVKGVATLEMTGQIQTQPDATLDLKPLQMTYNLSGQQSGSVDILQSTGAVARADISQHLTGSLTLSGPLTAPRTVPVTITSEVRCERK
jgi:hypothetical protein